MVIALTKKYMLVLEWFLNLQKVLEQYFDMYISATVHYILMCT